MRIVLYFYRLSRARRTVESGFGLLAARWRVFDHRIHARPYNVEKMVKASCVLHNYLITEALMTGNQEILDPTPIADINGMSCVRHIAPQRTTQEAMDVRKRFTEFFNSTNGSVSWQNEAIGIIGN